MITFDSLPTAVQQINIRLDNIEKLLKRNIDEPQQPEQDELLTVLQVAGLLKLSVPTIYGLVHRKEIPVCKRGKRLYFSKLEIMDWIRAGRKATFAETAHKAMNYLKTGKHETNV